MPEWLRTKRLLQPGRAEKARSTCANTTPPAQRPRRLFDARANAYCAEGAHAAATGNDYIRVTVILASVLFLVGISSHFPLFGIRLGVVCVGVVLLLLAAVEIMRLPGVSA